MGKLLAASSRQSRPEGAKRIGKLPKLVSDKSYKRSFEHAAARFLASHEG
jgi:hypothetical protein